MERTQNTNPTSTRQSSSVNGTISVKKILGLILHNWYWFVLSLAVAFGCAYLKIQKTPPVYSRTASILIKTDANSGDRTLRDLGITQTPSNLDNEILMMRTSVLSVARTILQENHLWSGASVQCQVPGSQ